MDRVVAFLPTLWSHFRGKTDQEFSENVEFIFLILHAVLVIACVIIPFPLGLNIAPFIILALFLSIYILIYSNLRYTLLLYFNLLLNSGVIVTIISIILFETGITIVASIMIVVGLVSVATFCASAALGYKVMVRNDHELIRMERATRGWPQSLQWAEVYGEEGDEEDDQPGQDNHPQQGPHMQVDQKGQDNESQQEANIQADQTGQDNESQQEANKQADQKGQDNESQQEANKQADQKGQEADVHAKPLSHGHAHQLVLPDGQSI